LVYLCMLGVFYSCIGYGVVFIGLFISCLFILLLLNARR